MVSGKEEGVGSMSEEIVVLRNYDLRAKCFVDYESSTVVIPAPITVKNELDVSAKLKAKIRGFRLELSLPQDVPAFLTQRIFKRGDEDGTYKTVRGASIPEPFFSRESWRHSWRFIVPVIRKGRTVWTKFPQNRADVFFAKPNGYFLLYQVGIVTHDDGETYRIISEERYWGRIFRRGEEFVVKPDPGFQDFTPWENILGHPEFLRLLPFLTFEEWAGSEEELHPRLSLMEKIPTAPENAGIVIFYVSFMGQKGMGYALLRSGEEIRVHGREILDPPDADGIRRLKAGSVIVFEKSRPSPDSKKPELIGVRTIA